MMTGSQSTRQLGLDGFLRPTSLVPRGDTPQQISRGVLLACRATERVVHKSRSNPYLVGSDGWQHDAFRSGYQQCTGAWVVDSASSIGGFHPNIGSCIPYDSPVVNLGATLFFPS